MNLRNLKSTWRAGLNFTTTNSWTNYAIIINVRLWKLVKLLTITVLRFITVSITMYDIYINLRTVWVFKHAFGLIYSFVILSITILRITRTGYHRNNCRRQLQLQLQ